jgi:hypothetical protein
MARHTGQRSPEEELLLQQLLCCFLLVGAYVANQVALASFQALNSGLQVEIRGIFF